MTASGAELATVALVLAGGTGSRVGSDAPKQLLVVAGRTILEHTLAVFEASPHVDEVVVVMAPGWVTAAEAVVTAAGFGKVSAVIAGGSTRNESTALGLDRLGARECNVLVHDAARPLVDERIIADCVAALRTVTAVNVVTDSVDTIVEVHGGVVTGVPDRARLRRVQTPQGFRAATLRAAYALAAADPGFTSTDDCAVVLRYLPGEPVHVVEGSPHNIKVTYPVDLLLVEQLLRSGPPES